MAAHVLRFADVWRESFDGDAAALIPPPTVPTWSDAFDELRKAAGYAVAWRLAMEASAPELVRSAPADYKQVALDLAREVERAADAALALILYPAHIRKLNHWTATESLLDEEVVAGPVDPGRLREWWQRKEDVRARLTILRDAMSDAGAPGPARELGSLLSERDAAVLDLIRGLPPGRAMTGPAICKKLAEARIFVGETVLTK